MCFDRIVPLSDHFRLPVRIAASRSEQRDSDHQRPQAELEAAAGSGGVHAAIIADGQRMVETRRGFSCAAIMRP